MTYVGLFVQVKYHGSPLQAQRAVRGVLDRELEVVGVEIDEHEGRCRKEECGEDPTSEEAHDMKEAP